jgi:integrase
MGFRKGEVLGLRWKDIDFDAEELTIELQIQRVKRQLLHRDVKTAGSRETLPMPDICIAALRRERERQVNNQKLADDAWRDTGLIFTTALGTPIDPRNFNRSWDNRCLRAGLEKITIHDGRRTCATLLVDLDVHPRHIMRILRHAQFSISMDIYAQASSRTTRAALKKLSESLEE